MGVGHFTLTAADIEMIGYGSAALGVLMLVMQTMIPLRITGVAHNLGQICFGLLTGIYPIVIQHAILLPINVRRLTQMTGLIAQVKHAANIGARDMEWLKPFMDGVAIRRGDVLFRKGDKADRMFCVLDGRLAVADIGVELGAGEVVGELGMLSPGQVRTHTVSCSQDARLLVMPYSRIEQLYYQNPTFGFYFLKLSSARLFENLARLERQLAESNSEIERLRVRPADNAASASA